MGEERLADITKGDRGWGVPVFPLGRRSSTFSPSIKQLVNITNIKHGGNPTMT